MLDPVTKYIYIVSMGTAITDVPFNVERSSGRILEGFITAPSGKHQPGFITVWMHGTMSDYNHNFTQDLANKMCKDHGICSYRFNLRYHSTENEPDHRYRFSGFDDDIDDMRYVVRALKKAGYEVWALIGHSRGANDALIYASRYYHSSISLSKSSDSVATLASMIDNNSNNGGAQVEDNDDLMIDVGKLAVVSIAPRFNMKRMPKCIFSSDQLSELEVTGKFTWETQRGPLEVTREDVAIVNKMDMKEIVTSIPASVPVLMLHGSEDELIPVEDAHAFKKARESIDLTVVEGARHAFRGKKQLKLLLNTVSTWLGERMPDKGTSKKVHSDVSNYASSSNNTARLPQGIVDGPTVTVEDSTSSVCTEVFPRCSFSRPNPIIVIV